MDYGRGDGGWCGKYLIVIVYGGWFEVWDFCVVCECGDVCLLIFWVGL